MMPPKLKQAIAEIEADGWIRFRTFPKLGRWIFSRKSERPGYMFEYRTIFRSGRTVPGCYER